MSLKQDPAEISIQARLFDFALEALVLEHRDRFQPLWTTDSWVKFLIWMTLNCGLSGERESLELFVRAIGFKLSSKMRRIFFERTIDDLELRIMADPADSEVLILPLQPGLKVNNELIQKALGQIGLLEKVLSDHSKWKPSDALVAIPWKRSAVSQ